MSTTIASPPPAPALALPRKRWTDEEFDRVVEAGIIREGSGTFLWGGEIIEPMAEDQPHINALYKLILIFASRFPEADWTVNINQPVQLEPGYRPQPDLVVLRGRRSLYTGRGRRPGPADVMLLVEVSDSSYPADSGDLLGRYARASIPQYWIVNIRARRIEVHSRPDPAAGSYRNREDFDLGAAVPLRVVIGDTVADFGLVPVRDVLQDLIDDAGNGEG